MLKSTDIKVIAATLYFLPVNTRIPYAFGSESMTSVTCARVRVLVQDRNGKSAEGWGESPLNVQWVWPSKIAFSERQTALKNFCTLLVQAWSRFDVEGHAIEVGYSFQSHQLPKSLAEFNESQTVGEPLPWLAALVCCSPFDIAIHDAFGILCGRPTYETYTGEFLNQDLGVFLESSQPEITFHGKFPCDFLAIPPPHKLPAWHSVGGKDWLERSEISPEAPRDGHPLLLEDWIRRDGLKCLKIKLCGEDISWDFSRILQIARIAFELGCEWFCTDFNCTVRDPGYVLEILNRLEKDHPQIFKSILYVEQPFPYDLEKFKLDVHSISSRKLLFMDESAHNWRIIRLGRELGWTGVALKTCKTQTEALLSMCWAKAHGMPVMVQDLTNPMIAQIAHVQLGAHAGTIMGLESNSMQFYPEASSWESRVHPGLYKRKEGCLDRSSVLGSGLGYRIQEINRPLPAPELHFMSAADSSA